MSDSPKTAAYFDQAIASLTAETSLQRSSISALRQEMDCSCDQGDITLKDWRRLLDAVANLQATLRHSH